MVSLAKKNKKNESTSKSANYTLYNQKITFEFLKSHLWSAADILRGSLDPSEYRQPVMTLLFIKRLNDTFEENAEKLIKEGKSQKEAYENKNRHYFFIPKDARWSVCSKDNIENGKKITRDNEGNGNNVQAEFSDIRRAVLQNVV
ncbi:MAG: type I restriction-modification system subunit M N-terminal domain-containing protein, partial [Nitrososphaeraceae archaeon]